MGVGRIFIRERSLEDFSRSSHKDLTEGGSQSGEISFFLFKTKKMVFFAKYVTEKYQISKSPFPTFRHP